MTQPISELSNCHKAPVHIGGDFGEGTHYYVCNECDEACNLLPISDEGVLDSSIRPPISKNPSPSRGLLKAAGVSDGEVRERIIEIIGLERTPQRQLIPINIYNFLSDWTLTIDALLALFEEQRISILKELWNAHTPDVVPEGWEPESPVLIDIKKRLAALLRSDGRGAR